MTFRQTCAAVLACAITAAASAPASAAGSSIATDSAVFVERTGPGNRRALEPASTLSRGERIVTVVSWHRQSGDGGFTITNPLPRTVAYQGSAHEDEDVSVDGGRSWGKLGQLRVGARLATPEDVTHIRWRVPPERALSGRGNFAYSGIVR